MKAIGCWKNFCAEESAQDVVEYALILAVLGLGAVLTLKGLATNIGSLFAAVGTAMTTPV